METDRLILRDWKDEDLEPFASLNGDSDVMEFFPSVDEREKRPTRFGYSEQDKNRGLGSLGCGAQING